MTLDPTTLDLRYLPYPEGATRYGWLGHLRNVFYTHNADYVSATRPVQVLVDGIPRYWADVDVRVVYRGAGWWDARLSRTIFLHAAECDSRCGDPDLDLDEDDVDAEDCLGDLSRADYLILTDYIRTAVRFDDLVPETFSALREEQLSERIERVQADLARLTDMRDR